jgi:glycosyltransferase involved in cell wall biosynthesis
MKILVSIVTCSLNLDKNLFLTLESIRNQNLTPIESIIVLPKNEVPNIEDFRRSRQLLHNSHFVEEESNGIYAAMNTGIKMAQGDYCLFLNAGDSFHSSSALASLYNVTRNHVWGYGAVEMLDKSGGKRIYEFRNFSKLKLKSSTKFVPHPATLVCKNKIASLGGFDSSAGVSADQELLFRISKIEDPKVTRSVITDFSLGGKSTRKPLEIAFEYYSWLRKLNEKIFFIKSLNMPILVLIAVVRKYMAR